MKFAQYEQAFGTKISWQITTTSCSPALSNFYLVVNLWALVEKRFEFVSMFLIINILSIFSNTWLQN